MLPPSIIRSIDLTRLSRLSCTLSGGILVVEVAWSDINYVVQQIATEAAQAKGVEIHSVDLIFEPNSTSSVRFRAKIAARKILFTAHINVTGRIVVNDLLEGVLTDLRASGDGMMGDLAALAVQPELEKYADRPIPLTIPASFPFHLGDVRLEAGPPIQIIATVSLR